MALCQQWAGTAIQLLFSVVFLSRSVHIRHSDGINLYKEARTSFSSSNTADDAYQAALAQRESDFFWTPTDVFE